MICTINEANLTSCFAHSFPSYPAGGMKTLMPFVSEAAKSVVQRWKTLDHFFGHPFKIRDCMMKAHVKSFPVIKKI